MKKHAFALMALATALAISPVVRADSFNFTFTDAGGVSGSGTLEGTFEGPYEWLITSGTGTFNDGSGSGAITLVANPNGPGSPSLDPDDLFAYDDLLFPFNGPNQYLDPDGLYFTYGSLELNLYQLGGGPGDDGWYENNGNGDSLGTFTITARDVLPSEAPPVPEPGTAVFLGTGLLLLAGLTKRRRGGSGPSLRS